MQLSRTTVVAGPPFHWPWSPSLPASLRLGRPFGRLPVLRGHPTSLVSSPSRLWFLDDYRPWAEAQRSPWVRTQNFAPTPASLLRAVPTDTGPLLEASSPSVTRALTMLCLRSVWRFTLDFHQTPPRGSLLLPPPSSALVASSLGFLRQDPRGLTPSCSAPMPGAPRCRPGFPRCRSAAPPAWTAPALSRGLASMAFEKEARRSGHFNLAGQRTFNFAVTMTVAPKFRCPLSPK
jgi:hypothetical protein